MWQLELTPCSPCMALFLLPAPSHLWHAWKPPPQAYFLPQCLQCLVLKLTHRCESLLSHSWSACCPCCTDRSPAHLPSTSHDPGFWFMLVPPSQRRRPDHPCPACSSTALPPHSRTVFSCYFVVPTPPLFSRHYSPGFTLDPTAYKVPGPKSEHNIDCFPGITPHPHPFAHSCSQIFSWGNLLLPSLWEAVGHGYWECRFWRS